CGAQTTIEQELNRLLLRNDIRANALCTFLTFNWREHHDGRRDPVGPYLELKVTIACLERSFGVGDAATSTKDERGANVDHLGYLGEFGQLRTHVQGHTRKSRGDHRNQLRSW